MIEKCAIVCNKQKEMRGNGNISIPDVTTQICRCNTSFCGRGVGKGLYIVYTYLHLHTCRNFLAVLFLFLRYPTAKRILFLASLIFGLVCKNSPFRSLCFPFQFLYILQSLHDQFRIVVVLYINYLPLHYAKTISMLGYSGGTANNLKQYIFSRRASTEIRQFSESILLNIMFHGPVRRFQLELISLFYHCRVGRRWKNR